MQTVPEEKHICKWCAHCEVFNENYRKETAICNIDIRELVEVNGQACGDFEYDDTFERY